MKYEGKMDYFCHKHEHFLANFTGIVNKV